MTTRYYVLVWDDNNIQHLWQSHRVSPYEVDEAINGVQGERFHRYVRRDGEYLKVFGQTGDGRLLAMVGEIVPDGLRVFSARDMNQREKRDYRRK